MVKSISFLISLGALSVTTTLARSVEQFRREVPADAAVDLTARDPGYGRIIAKHLARGAGEGIGSGIANRYQSRELAAEDEVDMLAAREPGYGRIITKSLARGAGEGLGSGIAYRFQGRELAAEDEVDGLAAREPGYGRVAAKSFARGFRDGVSTQYRREPASDDETNVFERELDEYLQERDLEEISDLYLD